MPRVFSCKWYLFLIDCFHMNLMSEHFEYSRCYCRLWDEAGLMIQTKFITFAVADEIVGQSKTERLLGPNAGII